MTKCIGFAMPRSGTAWLSNFLTYGEASYCRHEALYGCNSIDAYEESIESLGTPVRGSIDTAAGVVASAMVAKLQPLGYRFFVIVRPAEEVSRSLKTISCGDATLPAVGNGIHWLLKHAPGTPVLKYESLFTHRVLSFLWRYLDIPAPYPVQRVEMLREMLVEDGRIKGFGRFATDAGCREAEERFGELWTRASKPELFPVTATPRVMI